jgi:hypothetical protein
MHTGDEWLSKAKIVNRTLTVILRFALLHPDTLILAAGLGEMGLSPNH